MIWQKGATLSKMSRISTESCLLRCLPSSGQFLKVYTGIRYSRSSLWAQKVCIYFSLLFYLYQEIASAFTDCSFRFPQRYAFIIPYYNIYNESDFNHLNCLKVNHLTVYYSVTTLKLQYHLKTCLHIRTNPGHWGQGEFMSGLFFFLNFFIVTLWSSIVKDSIVDFFTTNFGKSVELGKQ